MQRRARRMDALVSDVDDVAHLARDFLYLGGDEDARAALDAPPREVERVLAAAVAPAAPRAGLPSRAVRVIDHLPTTVSRARLHAEGAFPLVGRHAGRARVGRTNAPAVHAVGKLRSSAISRISLHAAARSRPCSSMTAVLGGPPVSAGSATATSAQASMTVSAIFWTSAVSPRSFPGNAASIPEPYRAAPPFAGCCRPADERRVTLRPFSVGALVGR